MFYNTAEIKRSPAAEGAFMGQPSPYFRREFSTNKAVLSARVKITAKGLYALYINGGKADNSFLNPGWTDYKKYYYYQVFDVTDRLIPGVNTVGIILGDGWYTGHVAMFGRKYYADYPLYCFFEMEITYLNGETEVISSDGFKASCGDIISNDIIDGVSIDRNFNIDGFCTTGYNDEDWMPVSYSDVTEALLPQPCELVRETLYLNSTLVSETDGVLLYDFGQNFAGIIEARIDADKDAVIKLRYGEMLKPDGTLYTENLREAHATDYIISDGNPYVFKPEFTYHGFRFLEITTLKGTAKVSAIKGVVLHTDLEITGTFSCSSELVNKIYVNTLWSQRGNFISLPTDCPQRDERMGWTGDVQIFCRSAMYNMDCHRFFRKYLDDVKATMREDGAIYDVAPAVQGLAGYGHNAWGDVMTVLPYMHYRAYGDKSILLDNIDAAKRWVDYLVGSSDNYIRDGEGYGDWLSIGDDTDPAVMNTAYSAYSAMLTSEMCAMLSDNDADKYAGIYRNFKEAFNGNYSYQDGTIKSDTQTVYLLAMAFGLGEKEMLKQHLLRTLARKNNHLSTGFIGVRFLLPMLCDLGEQDIAYELITNTAYPSWGYSVVNSATTIWERWNSYTLDKGFEDIRMNSFNHYSFGSCTEWFFEYVLGIKPRNAGFDGVIIRPYIDKTGRITAVSGSYNSTGGKITVSWKAENSVAVYSIIKPAHLDAEFIFSNILRITQDGKTTDQFMNGCEHTEVVIRIG